MAWSHTHGMVTPSHCNATRPFCARHVLGSLGPACKRWCSPASHARNTAWLFSLHAHRCAPCSSPCGTRQGCKVGATVTDVGTPSDTRTRSHVTALGGAQVVYPRACLHVLMASCQCAVYTNIPDSTPSKQKKAIYGLPITKPAVLLHRILSVMQRCRRPMQRRTWAVRQAQ